MATARNPPSNVLRIAVVVDGRVSADLHQEQPGPVSVGTSYKSDLLLFGSAPEHHPLFDYRGGAYFLDLPAGARGKLRLRGRAVSVKQLRAQLGQGERLRVQLDSRAKGKLALGQSRLIFGLTAPKPVPVKPPFPAEFKYGFAAMIATLGALYLYSQLASALTLGSYFLWAATADYPTEVELDERFVAIMHVPQPKKETPEEEEEEDELAEEDEEKIEEKKKEPEPKKLKEKPENYSKQAMKEARSVGIARVLGTYGGPGEGTVFDVINDTENNLGDLFKKGMTTTVLADGGDFGEFVPGGDGITAHGNALATQGLQTGEGPALEGTDKRERKIKGRTQATRTDVTGDVDKKALTATIHRRTGALQHCYNTALRTQPDLAGKMTYTIFISVMGTVTKVVVEEDSLGSAAVTACAKAKIQGWRFPMNGAEEGAEVTFSVVFSGS